MQPARNLGVSQERAAARDVTRNAAREGKLEGRVPSEADKRGIGPSQIVPRAF